MTCLQVLRSKALIFIYRADELEKVLRDAGAQQLLATCGYSCFDITGALNKLRIRLCSNDGFPHEIGIFLGYPLEDVPGFIPD